MSIAMAMFDSPTCLGVSELGLTSLTVKMDAKGWKSFSTFAYSNSYIPGTADDSNFILKVVKELTDVEDSPHTPALKRLFDEAFTYKLQDIQYRTQVPDEENRRHTLPAPERAHRQALLSREYPGIKFDGRLLPSHALVDKVVTMRAADRVRHIRWEESTSRDQEIRGVKTEALWKTDANGFLKLQHESAVEETADLSSHLLLRFALTRRGAALHMGGIMSFNKHELLVERYLKALYDPIADGYQAKSEQELYNIDIEIFGLFADVTAAGLVTGPLGELPLDNHVTAVLADPRIYLLFMPLPKTNAGAQKRKGQGQQDDEVKRLRDSLAKANQKLSQMSNKGGGGKGKHGKGKRDKGRGTAKLPEALRGYEPTYKGRRLCFAWNLEGCRNKKCPKGDHLCMKCHSSSHGLAECNK